MEEKLSSRERDVLRYVVQDFIETATPVGSRYISRRHEDELGLSSASIRNVLSDLEELGYVGHPHTSAGRVPTDLGYRFYLDWLIRKEALTIREQREIRENLDSHQEIEEMISESSRLLVKISRQLSIVTSPQLNTGVFDKLELIQITSNRLMVVISIKSGLVRTIMMEVASEIARERLEELSRFLNERLNGLTIQQIRDTFVERVKDAQNEQTGLIRLFIDSVEKLFVPAATHTIHISGTDALVQQPEFVNPSDFRSIIELVSDEEIFIHVLQKHKDTPDSIKVTVGKENEDQKLERYSVITAAYSMGDVAGSIGVLGPKRMPYDRMIPLVDFVARAISEMFSNKTKQS
ncbi:MAG: heat-inducible transcription repressor HrcA [Bacteroidetes bacterium]|nr:heat-inducible transcription repressor HrcA [Bacteroidota bacterium]